MSGGSPANRARQLWAHRAARTAPSRPFGEGSASHLARLGRAALRAVRARPLSRVVSAVFAFRAPALGPAGGSSGLVRARPLGALARTPAPGTPLVANPAARGRGAVLGLWADRHRARPASGSAGRDRGHRSQSQHR